MFFIILVVVFLVAFFGGWMYLNDGKSDEMWSSLGMAFGGTFLIGLMILVSDDDHSYSESDPKFAVIYNDGSLKKLQQLSDSYLDRFGIKSVPINLTNEPITPQSAAYFGAPMREIFIKKECLTRYPEKTMKEIILHELTHAWIYDHKLYGMDGAHGPIFQKKLADVEAMGY